MGITEILVGLIGRKSQRTGMWKFFTERSKGKNAVALQKQRNDGVWETLEQAKGFDGPIVIRQGNGEWAMEIYKPGPYWLALLEPPFDRLVPRPALSPHSTAPQIESTATKPREPCAPSETDGERQ
jgi:hypothetical protein